MSSRWHENRENMMELSWMRGCRDDVACNAADGSGDCPVDSAEGDSGGGRGARDPGGRSRAVRPRVIDLNDRVLREVVIGLGGREVRSFTGAGFLCPIAGEIMMMPGMPPNAAVHQVDVDEQGQITGLF